MFHKDRNINQKIIELLDELCEWERSTGRGSTIIFIPHNLETETLIAVNGKPCSSISINDAVHTAFKERVGFQFSQVENTEKENL